MSAREDYIRRTSGGTKPSSSVVINSGGNSSSNNSSQNDSYYDSPAYEAELAKQQVFQNQRKSYTPPAQEYGPGPGEGRSTIDLQNLGFDPDSIDDMVSGLSPSTMSFFGYQPGMTNMPVQLYQMLMEGSLVTPMEAMSSNESGIGTYSDLEAGLHPMFPGGLQQYYADMSMPKFQSLGGAFGDGGGFNYGYGSGGGGSGGGGGGYYYGAGMQGQPKQRGQIGPGNLQEQVNQAFLSGGKPFAKGGIVSLVED
jgi:hypothetical protein